MSCSVKTKSLKGRAGPRLCVTFVHLRFMQLEANLISDHDYKVLSFQKA